MAGPSKHDGSIYPRKDGKALWMVYRDRNGRRIRESTNTEDWQEAQRKLRDRLQSRDDKILDIVRKGEQIQFADWVDFFLENYSKPPIRAEKTHAANERAGRHLKQAFGQRSLHDLTADDIRALPSTAASGSGSIKTAAGVIQKAGLSRRRSTGTAGPSPYLNVAVRKRLLPASPCSGVEFPVKVRDCFGRTTCLVGAAADRVSGA